MLPDTSSSQKATCARLHTKGYTPDSATLTVTKHADKHAQVRIAAKQRLEVLGPQQGHHTPRD
eukprot:1027256-Alexandrium_andersonii.AAC.1